MGYAIVGYFDPVSDERIKKLWRGLADIGVDDYLINSENNPHFKFAMFDTLDVGLAEKELRQIAAETKAVSLHFKKYGLYPNSRPFLTIDISDNIGVLKLHQDILNMLREYGASDTREYFVPGIWKPDWQLTVSFDKERLYDAISFLSETQLPFDGRLDRIGIIEFYPAKQLLSFPLA